MNKINKDNFKQDAYKYGFVTEIEDEKIPKGLNAVSYTHLTLPTKRIV